MACAEADFQIFLAAVIAVKLAGAFAQIFAADKAGAGLVLLVRFLHYFFSFFGGIRLCFG